MVRESIGTLSAAMCACSAVIGTLTAMTGTLTAITGTLTAITGTLNAIIGTLTATIGTLSAIILTVIAAHCPHLPAVRAQVVLKMTESSVLEMCALKPPKIHPTP